MADFPRWANVAVFEGLGELPAHTPQRAYARAAEAARMQALMTSRKSKFVGDVDGLHGLGDANTVFTASTVTFLLAMGALYWFVLRKRI